MKHNQPDLDELDKILGLQKPQIIPEGTGSRARAELEAYNRNLEKDNAKKREAILALIERGKLEAETELLDALYWMYIQYCSKGHLFMGAGETASELLENAGYITVDSAGLIVKDNGDSQEQRLLLNGSKSKKEGKE